MEIKYDEFKVMVKIPELDIDINSHDIDYQIYKSSKTIPDIAILNVWNLEEIYYKKFLTANFKVFMYTKSYDNGLQLIFSGYTNSELVRNIPILSVANDNKIPSDLITQIKLTDSKKILQNCFINKTYRESVSSSQIIQDCADAMGIKSVIYSDVLPEKVYSVYKAKGKPHVVIDEICRALNCEYLIQDEVLYLGSPKINNDTSSLVELNKDNSLNPESKNEYERLIITRLKSNVKPYDFVKCNFEDLEGIYKVSEVESSGNNYNTDGITKITVSLK